MILRKKRHFAEEISTAEWVTTNMPVDVETRHTFAPCSSSDKYLHVKQNLY
jgi:hypothetical protein